MKLKFKIFKFLNSKKARFFRMSLTVIMEKNTKAYSAPSQTSKMKLFEKILTINYLRKKLHLRYLFGF